MPLEFVPTALLILVAASCTIMVYGMFSDQMTEIYNDPEMVAAIPHSSHGSQNMGLFSMMPWIFGFSAVIYFIIYVIMKGMQSNTGLV